MKTKLKITILVIISFSFITGLQAQEDKYPETAIIKVIDIYAHRPMGDLETFSSKMYIINQDNELEIKELGKGKIFEDPELIKSSLLKLRLEIQKWQNNGFALKSSVNFSSGDYIVTTMILQKN